MFRRPLRHALALCLLVATGAGPGTATATAAPTREQAVQAGRDAYRYGFPLVDFLRIRRENTSVKAPDRRGNAPLNLFSHAEAFATPNDRTVVAPNVDTLYSIAQLDLGKGPIVLSHPNMGKRYFVFELVDPYTDVVGYVGTRTTGAKAGRFAIAWTKRKATQRAPSDVRTIRSHYRRLWVIGRTLATDTPKDLKAARKLQHRYTLTPLRRLGSPPKPPAGKPGEPTKATDPKGVKFFDALGDALKANPPPKRDAPLLERLKRFGIGAGLHPSQESSAAVRQGLAQGYASESQELASQTRLDIFNEARQHGGWYMPPSNIGDYGTDYLFRAQVAVVGIGANTPAEAVYPSALADAGGNLFDASKRYRLVFAPGQAPPAKAFWSLTMYDLDGFLVPNDAKRYAVGPFHPPLETRTDGSVVIALQRDKPSETDVNWLPTPQTGNFRLALRIYRPKPAVLDGTWKPPPVEPIP